MKTFQVITERDGKTTREPGETTTKIIRECRIYAAEAIQEIWDAIENIRSDPEQTLVAIIEEHPVITVLGGD